ncbi:multicopper oxidase family protein [Streptacidiphilus neutrinimicus]|uniref:multicopper oxidase family protein n=1 Tax=Streptacidiphilus neutrinimicus TaxID=105420 RepID=UPI001F2FBABC|nr:multicopper oxidase family protein [Streptacidiphilus neutrinimicus]
MGRQVTCAAAPGGRLPRRTRRLVQALTAATVLAGAVFGGQALASSAPKPPSTADQEKGMVAGRPFRDPADADTSATRRITITLDAHRTRFDLAGRKVWGESYDGRFVAPTIRVAPGSAVTIRLVNHLTVATNLHFHGLHVAPTGVSDDPFLCVAPGKSLTYRLAIPKNHPQGTFWYHSHAMGTTCPKPGAMVADDMDDDMSGPMSGATGGGMAGGMGSMSASPTAFVPGDVENQISAGLSGALVVGDDRTLLPSKLRHITAHTLVFKDAQIDAGGSIVQNTGSTSIDSGAPTVRLVNGQLRPVLSMRPNETQLWRLTNAGADIFYQLQLDGYRFTVIGEDGTPVAAVRTASSLLLPPGKRYDVLVTAGPRPGGAWLRTLAYSNGPQGDTYPNTRLLRLNVQGAKTARLPAVSGRVPTAAPDLSGARIVQRRKLVLSESADGNSFFINGKQFMMSDGSVFATPARLGTVEEWTVYNTSGEIHPFHLHTSDFQVMSVNGVAQPYTNRQDIIPVPFERNGRPGQVVIRIAFDDFPGRYMFHCHIAAHEDNGMMSFIDVVR